MNFLCFLLITSWTTLLAKPQYDVVNSGSSATAAKPSSKSGPIVRVDGDVHSEKAEENNLPSGLHPSNYDSDGQASRASPASSLNKNGQKPSGSNKKPQSSPADHSITADATKPKNNASAANLTIVPTKRPPTNAYESDAAPKTQQKAAKSPEGFVLGGESTTASSDSYQSTTPEISSSAETPTTSSDSYQSTTDMPETTSASTVSISSSEQPSESPSSTEQTTPSSTTVESTTTSASYEESKEEKHDDNKQPFSSELYESSTPTSDVNAESSVNSGNASAKNVDSSAVTNTASSETTTEQTTGQTTEQSSPTTSQSSYESSESGSDSSLPIPPTTQNTLEETSTLPPAIEPPSPATSEPETTSSEAQVAASSSSEQPNTPAPDYSAQTTEATSVEQTSQSTAGDYSQTTQPYESSTASSLNSAEPTASADASRNSGGYNPDGPPVSVLKPPTNSANQGPESQPQSPAYQPPKKPRAWKISQGNGNSMPVDGSTGNSDNTINAVKPSEQTNKHIQSSGYGENEMKTQSEKPAHVVSPQEAVGYDGIAETPSAMTQRDPIIERAEVSLTKLQKQIDSNSTPKRKWQKYKFDCETEQDDRGETLCQEWARGGLCEDHRPTRFLFCRLTCLCLGPPEDPITQLKQKRRKRLNNVRL